VTARADARTGIVRPAGRGQTLVEFALTLPVLLMLLFGVVDGGRLVYLNSVVSQAAREGARVAAVEASWLGSSDPSCGKTGGPICPATIAMLKSHVLAAANRMVAPFGTISTSGLYFSCDSAGSTPTGSWTGVSCANNSTNNVVSVRLQAAFVPITPVLSELDVTLSGSASMVIN
jgi:hypothetical protein